MKRLLVILAALAIPALCADETLIPMLTKHWQTSKAYTIAMAEAMPADGYASQPNPDEMTFAQQLAHLAGANALFFSKITGTPSPVGKPEKLDKASVIKMLNDSYDYVIKSMASLTPEQLGKEVDLGFAKMTGLEAIMSAMVHTAHHRGQCVVYLRVKGLRPAGYKF
jgi:uncharacterized damage-inducible protein DinB